MQKEIKAKERDYFAIPTKEWIDLLGDLYARYDRSHE